MSATIRGIVKEGKVIPEQELPEGASVHITLAEKPFPDDLREECEQWSLASAQSLDLVERLEE